MTNEANTSKPEGADREAVDKAAALVSDADALLGDAFGLGEWPEADAVDRFLSEGKLDRVLALYGQAMRLDASEPAYPWNLGSAMNRLGLMTPASTTSRSRRSRTRGQTTMATVARARSATCSRGSQRAGRPSTAGFSCGDA